MKGSWQRIGSGEVAGYWRVCKSCVDCQHDSAVLQMAASSLEVTCFSGLRAVRECLHGTRRRGCVNVGNCSDAVIRGQGRPAARQALLIRRADSRVSPCGALANAVLARTDADRPSPRLQYRSFEDDTVAEVMRKTLQEMPRDATRWGTRSTTRATGYAPSTIHQVWQAFSLQPHRSETFRLSAGPSFTDPSFVDKVRDIVGLYADPPQHAMVLCVDEKSRVQALDRTPPLLSPGQVERVLMTTRAPARPRGSQLSTLPPARSSDSATGAVAAPRSADSWIPSRPTFRPVSRFTS